MLVFKGLSAHELHGDRVFGGVGLSRCFEIQGQCVDLALDDANWLARQAFAATH